MTGWHAPTEALSRYVDGSLDTVSVASVDAHLIGCARCQAGVAAVSGRPGDLLDADAMWASIVDEVDRPHRPLSERLLTGCGVGAATARLLAATPGIRAAWWTAVGAAAALALLMREARGDDPTLYLLVAPLVPLVCLAIVFGRGSDPVGEIGAAAPTTGTRVLLLRVSTVLAAATAALGCGALTLPHLAAVHAAWLLPSLAVATVALALSTAMSAGRALGTAATGWMLGVTVLVRAVDAGRMATEADAFGSAAQPLWAAVVVAAVLVIAARHESFDRAGAR